MINKILKGCDPMNIEEIDEKEQAILNLYTDLGAFKYIELDDRPCEIYTKPKLEKFKILSFQLFDTIDGHNLYFELKADDGDLIGYSIPDITEVLSVDKETENEVRYKLKSFVRRFSREHFDIKLAKAMGAPPVTDKMTLAYLALAENTMYMTHYFILSVN